MHASGLTVGDAVHGTLFALKKKKMNASASASLVVERRSADRINIYLQFSYCCAGKSGALLAGKGVTINMSSNGALLLMPPVEVEPGTDIELTFNVREDHPFFPPAHILFPDSRGLSERPGTATGDYFPDIRGKAFTLTAMVIRIQPLSEFHTSSALRFGVAVAFTRHREA